jgi:LmbE family N-acetylglucosaminyl deacetylase
VLGLPDRDVERVLAIIAHPDDAEFWVGGTIAHWTDEGIQVTYCVLTDGSGEIPRIRRAEQQQRPSCWA